MKNKITKIFLFLSQMKLYSIYEKGKIRAPIHLSGNNENQLIILKMLKNKIFQLLD